MILLDLEFWGDTFFEFFRNFSKNVYPFYIFGVRWRKKSKSLRCHTGSFWPGPIFSRVSTSKTLLIDLPRSYKFVKSVKMCPTRLPWPKVRLNEDRRSWLDPESIASLPSYGGGHAATTEKRVQDSSYHANAPILMQKSEVVRAVRHESSGENRGRERERRIGRGTRNRSNTCTRGTSRLAGFITTSSSWAVVSWNPAPSQQLLISQQLFDSIKPH